MVADIEKTMAILNEGFGSEKIIRLAFKAMGPRAFNYLRSSGVVRSDVCGLVVEMAKLGIEGPFIVEALMDMGYDAQKIITAMTANSFIVRFREGAGRKIIAVSRYPVTQTVLTNPVLSGLTEVEL